MRLTWRATKACWGSHWLQQVWPQTVQGRPVSVVEGAIKGPPPEAAEASSTYQFEGALKKKFSFNFKCFYLFILSNKKNFGEKI